MCIVSGGGAYLIDVDARTWRAVEALPVTQLEEVPAAGILAVATFGDLVGYGLGPDAELVVMWRTEGLALDDLEIVGVDGRRIECRAHSTATVGSSTRERYLLDASTGAIIEGPTSRHRGFPFRAGNRPAPMSRG
ncbi:MAG: hypothetical protein QM598_00340 [Protaetiibacter sp.]